MDFCIKKNLHNELINKVIVFAENLLPSFTDPKMKVLDFGKRLLYSDAFMYTNNNLRGEIVIASNTDIFYDDSLRRLKNIDFKKLMLAITRRDYLDGEIIESRQVYLNGIKYSTKPEDCHDAWVFNSPIPKFDADFYFGWQNCEHAVVRNAIKAGIKVLNGYNFIKIYHVHKNNIRSKLEQEPYKVDKIMRLSAVSFLPSKIKFL